MSVAFKLIAAGVALLIAGFLGIYLFGAIWARIGFGAAMVVVVGGLLYFAWRQDKKAKESRAGLERI
jgi:hypothetical protein